MLRLMLQKLIHKKWLVISLLVGNILLIAIAASYPMYRDASLQKMLINEYDNYKEDNKTYPARIMLGHLMDNEQQVDGLWEMEERSSSICEDLHLTLERMVTQYSVQDLKTLPQKIREGEKKERNITLSSLSEFKDHSEILSGKEFSDTIGEDGYIDVVVSQNTFRTLNLLLGEEFACSELKGKDGKEIKMRVVGIFTAQDAEDCYWSTSPSDIAATFFISQDIFKSEFLYDKVFHNKIKGQWEINYDYTKVDPKRVDTLINKTKSMVTTASETHKAFAEPTYLKVLDTYNSKVDRVKSTFMILIVPLFVLLCAFIFMISAQMFSLEDSEISFFKSRGASKKQILCLYLLQSTCLALGGFVIGLPFAGLICMILGSTNAFLEFVHRTSLSIGYSFNVIIYGLAAAVVSILMTILPVLKSSSISIVHLKQKKARKRKSLWKKFYLDIVMLAVSLYGFYTFSRQKTDMLYRVITGKSLDPLLFFSSTLFILGAGLFGLRMQPLLVKLIYRLGRKKWKPANYASFLQIARTGNKQHFIMAFLILTIALGIFDSTVARTIVSNAEKNAEYSTGADLTFQEDWRNNEAWVIRDPKVTFEWYEPEYNRYALHPKVASAAKVYRNSHVSVISSEQITTDLMAINTKDFGNTAELPEGLNKRMFNEYLNVLSTNPRAVLLSSNYKKKGYKIGDTIELMNEDTTITELNTLDDKAQVLVIYGFVDYWPGYTPTTVKANNDGSCETLDNYMVIANLANTQSLWKVDPYQVWLKLKEPDTSFFYDFVAEHNIQLSSLTDRKQTILNVSKDSLFQGTNGILTMSFILILIICYIGYLIYWILSIRGRELLFGVFRAMGMSKRQVIHMLINEQLFTGGLSIVLGAGIGILASKLYIPMIQIAYAGDNQVLPLELMTKTSDIVKLFIIVILVFIVCMKVLAWLVNKLKIAEALKLGED